MKIISSPMVKSILLILTLVTFQIVAHPADQSEREIRQGQGGASSEIQSAKHIVNRYEQCLKSISERQQLARLQRRQSVQENKQEIVNLRLIVRQKQIQCLEQRDACAAQSRQHNDEFQDNFERAAEEVMIARSSRRMQLKASLAIDLSKAKERIKIAELNSKIKMLKAQKQQLTESTLELQERIRKMVKNSLRSLEREVEEQDQETRRLQQKMKAVLKADTNLRYQQKIKAIPVTKPETVKVKDDQHEDTPAQPARAASPLPTQNIPAKQEAFAGRQSQLQDETRKSLTIQEGDTEQKKQYAKPKDKKTIKTVPEVIPPSQHTGHKSPPPEKEEVILPTQPTETAPSGPSQLSPIQGTPSQHTAHFLPPVNKVEQEGSIVDTTEQRPKIVDTTELKPKIIDTTKLPITTQKSQQSAAKEPVAGQVVHPDLPKEVSPKQSSTQTTATSIKQLLQQSLSLIKAIEADGNYDRNNCAELQTKIAKLDEKKRSMDKCQRDQFAFVSAVIEINCEDYYAGKQIREMDLRLKAANRFQSLEHNHNQKLLDLLGKIQKKHPKPSKDMLKKLKKLENMYQASCRALLSSLQESAYRVIANKRGQRRNAEQCSEIKQLLMTFKARAKFMSRDQQETYMLLKDQYRRGCVSLKPPKAPDNAH